jgi:uncharacterized protein (TIGR03435 family)
MRSSRALFMVSMLWWMVAVVSAQGPVGLSPVAQSATAGRAPQSLSEMEAAGVRMAFDVASAKPNSSNAPATSRFPLGPGDAYTPGGFFSATNQALIVYLRFAYKYGQSDLLGLPAWIYNDRFDIEARAAGSPTKDHMRLMMQSLLADRFKLVTHRARQTRPVLSLVLAKAGRTGPQLHANSEKDSCSGASNPPPGAAPNAGTSSSTLGLTVSAIPCGSAGPVPANASGRGRLAGRHVTIGRIAALLMNPFTGVDRPVLDRTALTGTFDFSLEWSLASDQPEPPVSRLEDTGPTFLQALQDQLGLKLKTAKSLVDVLVIDHVEHPTRN